MTQKRTRQKPGDKNYVNNVEFTQALHEYSKSHREAEEAGIKPPQMSTYLAMCVMKMANRLATSGRFSGYSFRDELVQNAILGAVKYMHKFDGTRFNNGFAYVTQILFSHMIITIKNEKKRYEGNLRLIQEAEASLVGEEEFADMSNDHARSIADQKLKEIEDNRAEKGKGGFQLRSGYTKESRAKMKGTPMDEYINK